MLRILKQINADWAVGELTKIAKMDISSSWDEDPVEFEAFMHILLGWEGTGGVLSLIAEISQKARREDIRLEACKILQEWV